MAVRVLAEEGGGIAGSAGYEGVAGDGVQVGAPLRAGGLVRFAGPVFPSPFFPGAGRSGDGAGGGGSPTAAAGGPGSDSGRYRGGGTDDYPHPAAERGSAPVGLRPPDRGTQTVPPQRFRDTVRTPLCRGLVAYGHQEDRRHPPRRGMGRARAGKRRPAGSGLCLCALHRRRPHPPGLLRAAPRREGPHRGRGSSPGRWRTTGNTASPMFGRS